MSYEPTAIEAMKAFSIGSNPYGSIHQMIRSWSEDKDIPWHVIQRLAEYGKFGELLSRSLLRSADTGAPPILDYVKSLDTIDGISLPDYEGAPEDNVAIDQAWKVRTTSSLAESGRLGIAAATFYRIPVAGLGDLSRLRDVPIAVLGAGPSGAMIAYALKALGFGKISLFYRDQKSYGGIWTRPNVKRSRNNPADIDFSGATLPHAPGNGEDVLTFTTILLGGLSVKPLQAHITRIEPGHLNQKIHFQDGSTQSFPIVINCLGVGSPKPLDKLGKMRTSTTKTEAGNRWQQTLDAHKVKGKSVVIIGCGNSAAEMILQLQKLRANHVEVDYKVLTHYPEDAIRHPWSAVPTRSGKVYRVFRDLSKPDLTGYAGDLEDLRRAYMLAVVQNRIISGVHSWKREDGYVRYTQRQRRGYSTSHFVSLSPDQMYTLIGYGIPKDQYQQWGIQTAAYGPKVDYDGEFQSGRSDDCRVLKGYFGLGPVIETDYNPNAVVIPGNIFRIMHMVPTIVLRALEYQMEQEAKA